MGSQADTNGEGEALRRLKRQLDELRTLASRPSLDDMTEELRTDPSIRVRFPRTPISKASFSRFFSNPPSQPSWPNLLRLVVEYLAKETRETYELDPVKVWAHFRRLSVDLISEQNPPAPGPDEDEGQDGDGPETGASPARPHPRGPRSSGGGSPAVDAGRDERPPVSLLDVLDDLQLPSICRCSNPNLLVDLTRELPDRTLRSWSDALSLRRALVAQRPTSSELRKLIAEALSAPSETAILWLRAPVVWDSETGEAHLLTRDSEFDDVGTLWNTVPYTEVQYAITRSAAKSVFVVVLASRDPGISSATVPIAQTQWADTLFADDGPARIDSASRPAFLLWLRDSADADYSEALLQALRSSASPNLTAAALAAQVREVNQRFGLPAPYAAARNGGDAIEIGRSPKPRFTLHPVAGDREQAILNALLVRRGSRTSAELTHSSVTAIAMGQIAGVDVIVAACVDGSLQLWDAHTGGIIQTLNRTTPPITALAIGRAGGHDFIVAGVRDHAIVMWEVFRE